MKKVILVLTMLAGAWSAQAQWDNRGREICQTSSRGQRFEARGPNARNQVVRECTMSRFTDRWECERNVQCYNDQGNGGGGGWGDSRLYANLMFCQDRDLCTFNIQWSARSNVVILIDDHRTGEKKLFACAGGSGNQQANWIPRNSSITFTIYETAQCSVDAWRYSRPVDSIEVYGNQRL